MSEPPVVENVSAPIRAQSIATTHPQLAGAFADIAAESSHLDVELGLLLADLLGADHATGLAMYTNLRSARRHALMGAAKERLDKPQLKAFEKMMEIVGKAKKKRDDVIHGHWFTSPDYPDTLLNAAPDESLKSLADLIIAQRGKGPQRHWEQPRFRSYKTTHFESVRRELWLAWHLVMDFQLTMGFNPSGLPELIESHKQAASHATDPPEEA